MRRGAVAIALSLVLGATVSCSGRAASGCSSPDDALVASVMSHARSQFVFGRSKIDRIELVRAKQVPLPAELRDSGGESLLALRTMGYFASPVSDALAGAQATDLFLIGAGGEVIAPIGTFAATSFTYPTPTSSGWAAMSARIEGSRASEQAYGCASGERR